MQFATRHLRARRRSVLPALAVVAVAAGLLAACAPGSGPAPTSSSSAHEEDGDNAEQSAGPDGQGAGPDGQGARPAREVDYAGLIADPDAYLGERVSVGGNVFFHTACPPPGAQAGPCVLLGYLVDEDQQGFIAADEASALALAEGGMRVSCEEGGEVSTACPGWVNGGHYLLVGTLERQVLGGRETRLVQLDVDEQTALSG